MPPSRSRYLTRTDRRRALGRRLLLSALLILTAGLSYRLIQAQRPAITSIPARAPGQLLHVVGHGFGAEQGRGQVTLLRDGQALGAAEVRVWSDHEIMVSLPAGSEATHAQVTRDLFGWRSAPAAFVEALPGLPSEPYGYRTPVQAGSPWPAVRRDHRNTGRTSLPPVYAGDRPWSYVTGKGIFSTPVIDAEGNVYVGSADHVLYSLAPGGRLRWSFRTGEIIDSAAALVDSGADEPTLLLPSGDGSLYHLRTTPGLSDEARLIWKFTATESAYNNWFEGNVVLGFDGTIYAGNTNFNYYALTPDGDRKWLYPTGANAWSAAALADDGTLYWGSNDTRLRAVAADGREKWSLGTLGFIAASAAVGSDGTVYLGSFDSNLYAVSPTGQVGWRFTTQDHIYASVALGQDEQGETDAIYFGSADGFFYALRPDGTLLWKYDAGDPIRSSPALGPAPEAEAGGIVYFGAGDGRLYALNTLDGTRRWSFDTTPDDPELRDRNDLNGSPALGQTGVYIGGETGLFWYVPYDYCLNVENARCDIRPGDGLPLNTVGLRYVTAGGTTLAEFPGTLPASPLINLRLVVRQAGESVIARVCSQPIGCPEDALEVASTPPVTFTVEPSADGRFLHLRPDDFLQPGAQYTLTVQGRYYVGPWRLGNLKLGGREAGRFAETFTFKVEEPKGSLPLQIRQERVTALEWTRLAVPLPPMMPSLNQIGFDYMDWIMGPVTITVPDEQQRGRFVLWTIGGRRGEAGQLAADPETVFILPLNGRYQGDSFILVNQDFTLPVTGIPIPFNLFELRGSLGADGRVQPGAAAYADTQVLSIPTFGPYLVAAGLANNWYEKLLVSGTYITRAYPPGGPAARRPSGVSVSQVDYQPPTASADGWVTARLELAPGAAYPRAEHVGGLLLVDAARTEAVYLDYAGLLQSAADAQGNLSEISLAIPKGTRLPRDLAAYVMLDVYPIHQQALGR